MHGFLQDEVISKFNPNSRTPYVCKSDNDEENPTIFYIKPLNIYEYRICEELGLSDSPKIGQHSLTVLKYGLVGWDNFFSGEEAIPFDFDNVSCIPYLAQLELSEIIQEYSEVSDELAEEIVFTIKWSNWLNDNEKDAAKWDCDYCQENSLVESRNCGNENPYLCPKCNIKCNTGKCGICGSMTRHYFIFKLSNMVEDVIRQCPISLITMRAVKLINLINYIDNAKALPFPGGAFEQTNFFYTARMIVLSEQNQIMKSEIDNIGKKEHGDKVESLQNRRARKHG